MRLPNHEDAMVPEEKLTGYLLSSSHPDGKHKAVFFTAIGFASADWQSLQRVLLQHVVEHDVVKVETTKFGLRYVVEGIISAPDGRSPLLRTVWFIRNDEGFPRFVTAYPMRTIDDDK